MSLSEIFYAPNFFFSWDLIFAFCHLSSYIINTSNITLVLPIRHSGNVKCSKQSVIHIAHVQNTIWLNHWRETYQDKVECCKLKMFASRLHSFSHRVTVVGCYNAFRENVFPYHMIVNMYRMSPTNSIHHSRVLLQWVMIISYIL